MITAVDRVHEYMVSEILHIGITVPKRTIRKRISAFELKRDGKIQRLQRYNRSSELPVRTVVFLDGTEIPAGNIMDIVLQE